jgi:multicomponent Na+:H+ antiporter subunit E
MPDNPPDKLPSQSSNDLPPLLDDRLKELRRRAVAVLRVHPQAPDSELVCPLCSVIAPARGLRVKPLRGKDAQHWQVVYTCPACGYIAAFDIEGVDFEQIRAMRGTAWVRELRSFARIPRSDSLQYMRGVGTRHFIGTFLTVFATWMLLTGSFVAADLAWGIGASLIVARVSYRFAAIDVPWWITSPRRWIALFQLAAEFIRQLVVQNVTLSIRVFSPRMRIRPGIVAVPVELKNDASLTVLGSLMSLTPDTVTMDIDQKHGLVYVHWIDVTTTDPEVLRRELALSLEEKIVRWLH